MTNNFYCIFLFQNAQGAAASSIVSEGSQADNAAHSFVEVASVERNDPVGQHEHSLSRNEV